MGSSGWSRDTHEPSSHVAPKSGTAPWGGNGDQQDLPTARTLPAWILFSLPSRIQPAGPSSLPSPAGAGGGEQAVLRGRGWNEDEEARTRSAGPWEVAGVCPHQRMSCWRRTDRGTCPKPHGGRNRLPGWSKRQTNTRSPGWRRRESRDEVAPGSPTSHRVVCSCRFETVAPIPWEVPPWSGDGHFPWCGSCSSWTEVDGMGSRNTEKRDGGLGEQDLSGSSPLDQRSNISPQGREQPELRGAPDTYSDTSYFPFVCIYS
ncbi:uncharacterized protein LOC113999636 isoform X2 [Pipra filicauda]|uniref:Uncharacterized protein LOC113999636 isoform X2 n=1 Tax=Pipra filicauda TaxID=649802 RepID=A0A7R5KM63_9PASS|nr:uncharacterized protein LOC113999636 isoform X2 [Pipra filicauda]